MADAPAEGEEAEAQPVEAPAPTEEELEKRRPIFQELYAEYRAQEAKEKSLAERKENELESKALTYAEVDFDFMHRILATVKEKVGPLYVEKGVFLDLGSGVGKACLAAALLHPFEKVVGFETIQCLSDMAGVAAGKYKEVELPQGMTKPEAQLVKANFVDDFEAQVQELASQVTVCFVVATCYGERELNTMAAVGQRMPEGSAFVTISQALPESLVVDHGKNPKQRRAAAVRKALAKRGLDPSAAGEIEVEPPPYDPQGFELAHMEELQVPWSSNPAVVFFYKKIPALVEEKAEGADAEGGGDENLGGA
eukprot:CAMPEP_0170261414 /NCGR_PEP_ID=MMETSP0116_2-20130129/30588_1 /TAXON_ID=400756 /ORGANISM="Durinskia baltica, Strain CSIRO CS-38" /LENGTH=309 /DNA_ID=CAMNT_0010512479 /DNA_START=84 /DNA_END=1013 /DNA_ORIENTATION=-